MTNTDEQVKDDSNQQTILDDEKQSSVLDEESGESNQVAQLKTFLNKLDQRMSSFESQLQENNERQQQFWNSYNQTSSDTSVNEAPIDSDTQGNELKSLVEQQFKQQQVKLNQEKNVLNIKKGLEDKFNSLQEQKNHYESVARSNNISINQLDNLVREQPQVAKNLLGLNNSMNVNNNSNNLVESTVNTTNYNNKGVTEELTVDRFSGLSARQLWINAGKLVEQKMRR